MFRKLYVVATGIALSICTLDTTIAYDGPEITNWRYTHTNGITYTCIDNGDIQCFRPKTSSYSTSSTSSKSRFPLTTRQSSSTYQRFALEELYDAQGNSYLGENGEVYYPHNTPVIPPKYECVVRGTCPANGNN